jgi:hypothetical protein
VDAFPLMVLGGIGIVVFILVLIGRFYPGTGADILDWRPTRSYETEIELEMQDVEQMIEAQNQYRRRRGERELTEDEVRENVAREEIERLDDEDKRLADQD